MALSGAGLLWSEAIGPWHWPGIRWVLDDYGTLAFLTFLTFLTFLVFLAFLTFLNILSPF